jgi:hypothetical protein
MAPQILATGQAGVAQRLAPWRAVLPCEMAAYWKWNWNAV